MQAFVASSHYGMQSPIVHSNSIGPAPIVGSRPCGEHLGGYCLVGLLSSKNGILYFPDHLDPISRVDKHRDFCQDNKNKKGGTCAKLGLGKIDPGWINNLVSGDQI